MKTDMGLIKERAKLSEYPLVIKLSGQIWLLFNGWAASAMSTLRFTIRLVIFSFVSACFASPADDLASPSQATRDAAAKIARATWVAPARTNWYSLVAEIKTGTPRANVLELLRTVKTTALGAGGGGGLGMIEGYRLDDLWVLDITYREGGNFPVVEKKLVEQMKNTWVQPPTNFSGVWITYWANGQRATEVNYKNGLYHGEWMSFYPDGKSKEYVMHYNNGVSDGEDMGYYRSGSVRFRRLWKQGKPVGTSVEYNKDGSTNSISQFSTQ